MDAIWHETTRAYSRRNNHKAALAEGAKSMSKESDARFDDCNVIYSECCFTMAKRFQELGQKYKKQGRLELAVKLEAEAVIQLDAWRKARDEHRLAS
jgi:hypothetical protein